MDLKLDVTIATKYTSNAQKMRVITENWVVKNLFCPICGTPVLSVYENNKPVADFFCEDCNSDFELKSKENSNGNLGKKIVDGAYDTMISRITSLENPNFLFMTHNNNEVNNCVLIPNYFFVPEIIEKRKPLSDNARRAGWVGCNIDISKIPESGKIYIVKNSQIIEKQQILANYKVIKSLKSNNLESRGWIIDTLNCIDQIPTDSFTLTQMYTFTDALQEKHPNNHFIQDKIRQQLQYLRDKGIIEFTSRGNYKKMIND
ncbi:MAG: DpnI domain-containing protein [Rikenellaceae bacterium]